MIIPGQLSAELAAVLAALLIPAVLAEPARRLALRYDLIDRSARHRVVFRRRIVPYLGGILVVVGTLVPALAVTGRIDIRLTAVVAGAVTVGILGFLRDLRRIALPFGMAMQAMMAFALAIGQVRLHVVQPGWLDIVLTALWVLGVANAFRLLDQVDGLLPTAVCATAVPLAAAAFVTDQPELAFLLVCFAAACCGFLLHNAPPMRIAMGASGGHFAGFLIAASAAVIRHADHATFDGMPMVMLVTSGGRRQRDRRRGRTPWAGTGVGSCATEPARVHAWTALAADIPTRRHGRCRLARSAGLRRRGERVRHDPRGAPSRSCR